MPGQDKRKYKASSTKTNRDQANEFVGIKKNSNKQANEFSGTGKSSNKSQVNEFSGLGKNKNPIKQANEFSGTGSKKNKVTKSIVSKKTDGNKSKPKVITPAMIKAKGFTTLRDYLNNEKGLKRKDGKKVVKTSKTSSSMPKPPPKAPRGKNKIVPSLKTSSAGIDGGSSQVNKAKKKIVKKNPMSTKTPKTFKGTNITPTKLQRDRMRKRAMGST